MSEDRAIERAKEIGAGRVLAKRVKELEQVKSTIDGKRFWEFACEWYRTGERMAASAT